MPGHTGPRTQNAMENNRLNRELKKLERDKNISINQLSANQAQLQKSLRDMTAIAQAKSSSNNVDVTSTLRPAVSSGLNVNTGASRGRIADRMPSSSRVSTRATDPDMLATVSTKSFHGQIIGGQAQRQRMVDSRVSLMAQSSRSNSKGIQHDSTSKLFINVDSTIYNLPESGKTTGVKFTEEEVEQGVQEHSHEVTPVVITPVPQPPVITGAPPAESVTAASGQKSTSGVAAGAGVAPAAATSQAGAEVILGSRGTTVDTPTDAQPQSDALQSSAMDDTSQQAPAGALDIPTLTVTTGSEHDAHTPAAAAAADDDSARTAVTPAPTSRRSVVVSSALQDDPALLAGRQRQAAAEAKIAGSVPTTQPRWSAATRGSFVPSLASKLTEVKQRLSRISRSTTVCVPTTSHCSQTPPLLPDTITEAVYCTAVDRAFATKCLKHTKLVTDIELREFVLQHLLVEQQNNNFKKANEFVDQLMANEAGNDPNVEM